jgi:hypothetical protein
MLFVGESPPASGRFFYHRDSGLYRAMRDALQHLDPTITREKFMAMFQRTGCYLIDLCRRPVDRMDTVARRTECSAGEALLSRRIQRLQPEIIVVLVRSISPNVQRSAAHASWTRTMVEVPYPGRWIHHRKVFLESLVPHLRTLLVIPARAC